MPPPTRRTLLTGAALAAATAAAAVPAGAAPGGSEVPLVIASRAAAMEAAIADTAMVVLCLGYEVPGDGGQALYRRAGGELSHRGGFRSRDGGWWELAEPDLNPFQFGARGDGSHDDAPAIQAMFDFVEARGRPYPMRFLGGTFRLEAGLRLPTVPSSAAVDIDGGGATLRIAGPGVIFARLPRDQADAMVTIGRSRYDIRNFHFRGTGAAGQTGIHIGASYANVVRGCSFAQLEYGAIATFCLASAWRDNLYQGCFARALVLQTGAGSDHGPVWPGATESNSASNVSTIENCRVYGHPRQRSAFAVFGSDAVRVTGCISEGDGAATDLVFDFQGSPVVKNFHVDMFHCEAPRGTLNFQIRATGKVVIERVVRSYAAALIDARGCTNCEIIVRGLAWLGGLPEPRADGPNPRGRWFFHANGKGFGAGDEGGLSGGTCFRFEDCVEEAWAALSNPARWESGRLPEVLTVTGLRNNGRGTMFWSSAPMEMLSPLAFADGTRINGMLNGVVAAPPVPVPPQGGVSLRLPVTGLDAEGHVVFANPVAAQELPPALAWTAHPEGAGVLVLRLTNAGARPIELPATNWRYCAMRRG
ncbi:hypothetical protein ACFQ1E_15840 [Sphingomonas canadensis]|uniref:Pectate lyase superfamily protein domain-containing protein n=1 Tax=Sphingomonas canadensis TaxID=1219257 RepID=A0ABW3HEP6_9SPHN|nr:hypothetical protein [Sphingomonas canadensis]MCW3837516.1 hypothetical protein [Sphingomonas canadensis]